MNGEVVKAPLGRQARTLHRIQIYLMRILAGRYTIVAMRIIVGAVFVVAGLGKLYDPRTFTSAVATYDFLPETFKRIAAIALPWAELVIGVYTISGLFLAASLFSLTVMLGVFAAAIGISAYNKVYVDCGCFGPIGTNMGMGHFVADVLLLLAALLVLSRRDHFLSLDALLFAGSATTGTRRPSARPTEWAERGG